MSADWTSEVREILAHAEGEEEIRAQLEALCETYSKENPFDPEVYEFGVAVLPARRKRWTFPSPGEHGTFEHAEIELKALQRLPGATVKIVKRVKTGPWVDA